MDPEHGFRDPMLAIAAMKTGTCSFDYNYGKRRYGNKYNNKYSTRGKQQQPRGKQQGKQQQRTFGRLGDKSSSNKRKLYEDDVIEKQPKSVKRIKRTKQSFFRIIDDQEFQESKATKMLAVHQQNYTLTPSQEKVLQLVTAGHNVFFTGPAGTGKSFLVSLLKDAIGQDKEKVIRLLAPTGTASTLIDGNTIHSFFGLSREELEADDRPHMIERSKNSNELRRKWLEVTTLFLDEASMITDKLLEQLDAVAKGVRVSQAHLPMAGIQVLCCGDFYQLAPITKGKNQEPPFCFKSSVWNALFKPEHHVLLKEPVRQKEPNFIKMLNEARDGKLSQETKNKLAEITKATNRRTKTKDADTPMRICSHTDDVDKLNHVEFAKLSKEVSFTYKVVFKEVAVEKFQMTKGGKGKKNDKMKTMQKDDKDEMERDQPKRYMYKHPSQRLEELKRGCPLDKKLMENGLELRLGAKVMLLINLDQRYGLINGARGQVIGFEKVEEYGEQQMPIVKFQHGVTALMKPYVWYNMGHFTVMEMHQLPLMHAWAITIHKAQGATFDQVDVQMGKAFAPGQSYVALSRVRTLGGLGIISWSEKNMKPHPDVKKFYAKLEGGQSADDSDDD